MQGRTDSRCDVIVCKASALKRPKGAKPGQVLVSKELGNAVARPDAVAELAIAAQGPREPGSGGDASGPARAAADLSGAAAHRPRRA